MTAADIWRAAVVVPQPAISVLENALGGEALAYSIFETTQKGLWSFEMLLQGPLNRPDLETRLALISASLNLPVTDLILQPIPDKNWVAESQSALSPIQAGRIFVHGAHDRGTAPSGSIALEVDAGRAFGTGRHESTNGCLLALDYLAKSRRFSRPLDLGCGTGVLALAMARLWRVPIVASDVDFCAVTVANTNARLNRLHPWIQAVLSDGFANPKLSKGAPYDLIVANILARPLQRLAPQIVDHLAPRGRVILSGILLSQDSRVRSAYRTQGLHLVRRRILGKWLTLELSR